MNTKKQTPNSKLQKSSVIFMQLGLILALLAVYATLEHKSFVKYTVNTYDETYDPFEETTTIDEVEIEVFKKRTPKVVLPKVLKPTPKVPKSIENIKIVDNTIKTKETKVYSTEIEPKDAVPIKPKTTVVIVKKKEILKTTHVNLVQIVPTFPGCMGSNEEKKQCLNKKINKHIQKYFDIDLAQDLGLSEGEKRISVQFIIDQNGNIVEIKVRAPHKKLEKEAKRIMKKLPKMIPGKQNNKQVRVRYSLPINFNVID